MILSVITLIWLLNSALSAKIPVTIEEVTSPVVKFASSINSMIVHPSDPRLVIVIDKHAIWKFNPETKTKTLIAGSQTSGYVEGFGENARFGDIYGSANFNETTIIFTSYSHCVRLVNTDTRLTERYAGVCQSYGFKDGDRLSAQFRYPFGISRIGADFYICDRSNKKIRKISQNVVSTITSVSYPPHALSSNNDKLVYTFNHGLGEFDLKSQTNKILAGGRSAGYPDGCLSSAQFNTPFNIITLTENILAIADYGNRAVHIIDHDIQTVSSVDLSGYPYSILAYNGNILGGVVGGSIMKFNMSKLPVDNAEVNCPDDMKMILPPGVNELKITLQPPQVDELRLKRINNWLDSVQSLSEGVHNITYEYMDIIYNQKVSCSHLINVIKQSTPVCQDSSDGESTDGESADGESTDGESTDAESTDAECTENQESEGTDQTFIISLPMAVIAAMGLIILTQLYFLINITERRGNHPQGNLVGDNGRGMVGRDPLTNMKNQKIQEDGHNEGLSQKCNEEISKPQPLTINPELKTETVH